jgi:AraC family transcriptional regulator
MLNLLSIYALLMQPLSQTSRINDVLYAIHSDITADLSGRTLCKIAAYSEQHFHRVFRRVTGETLHGYILRTRLEHAANQLTFDLQSPVIEVAQKCGFSSLSSFSRAFNQSFGSSPGRWRREHQRPGITPRLEDADVAAGFRRITPLKLKAPKIEELSPRAVAYVRHQGYNREISSAWQLLRAWTIQQDRLFTPQIGLHHSNPTWVPLEQCRYVACVGIDQPILRRGLVNSLTIPGGTHAKFALSGRYGELLPWLTKIHEQWLPESGWKLRTTPAFALYHRNHFLQRDEKFELDFFLPVSLY